MEGLAESRSDRRVYAAGKQREWHPARWLIPLGVVAVLAAVGAWQVLTAPSVAGTTPRANAHIGSTDVPVTLTVEGLQKLRDIEVRVDGRDISGLVRTAGDQLSFVASGLADGDHVVTLQAGTSNLYRRSIDQELPFTVDTTPPDLTWSAPKTGEVFETQQVVVNGQTEPGTGVDLQIKDDIATTRADGDGRFQFAVILQDGRHKLKLTTRDKAGNTRTVARRIAVNRYGPVLTIPTDTTLRTGQPVLEVGVSDPIGKANLIVTVDGERVFEDEVSGTRSIKVDALAEGTHVIKYTATDASGKSASRIQEVVIDSTEKLGQKVLGPGAVGKDVKELQKLLIANKVYRYEASGTYTPGTTAAVNRFQKRLGLAVDGRAGPDVIAALHGRIVVVQSAHTLRFYEKGKLKFTFGVATGMASYPTPNGLFRVVVMAKNPTWIPPDSPWAKGLEPIPPGSGNPLGTRWIGTSAPGVGIHGTPADWSIGSYASHGCIRMHIWDVEKLYDYVQVGMPVFIKP